MQERGSLCTADSAVTGPICARVLCTAMFEGSCVGKKATAPKLEAHTTPNAHTAAEVMLPPQGST